MLTFFRPWKKYSELKDIEWCSEFDTWMNTSCPLWVKRVLNNCQSLHEGITQRVQEQLSRQTPEMREFANDDMRSVFQDEEEEPILEADFQLLQQVSTISITLQFFFTLGC